MGAGLSGQRVTLKRTSFATANQSQTDEWTIGKRLSGFLLDFVMLETRHSGYGYKSSTRS
jgi:hypothetical protein